MYAYREAARRGALQIVRLANLPDIFDPEHGDLVELHLNFPLALRPGRRPEPAPAADAIPAEVKIPNREFACAR